MERRRPKIKSDQTHTGASQRRREQWPVTGTHRDTPFHLRHQEKRTLPTANSNQRHPTSRAEVEREGLPGAGSEEEEEPWGPPGLLLHVDRAPTSEDTRALPGQVEQAGFLRPGTSLPGLHLEKLLHVRENFHNGAVLKSKKVRNNTNTHPQEEDKCIGLQLQDRKLHHGRVTVSELRLRYQQG